jgi:hypothetical protein
MRVVVVGATGNVGIAVLRRLAAEPRVDAITGVVRRVPPANAGGPYTGPDWRSIDVGSDGAVERLTDCFAGAGAVIPTDGSGPPPVPTPMNRTGAGPANPLLTSANPPSAGGVTRGAGRPGHHGAVFPYHRGGGDGAGDCRGAGARPVRHVAGR